MLTWTAFPYFAAGAATCWLSGAILALSGTSRRRLAVWITGAGILIMTAFLVAYWVGLERPPLRTMGETRLWYALFVMVAGWFVYVRWHYPWLVLLTTVMAVVFLTLNLIHPELHDRTLMPALQSYWFVPHVAVYMMAYALLGCTFLLAIAGCVKHTGNYLPVADRLAYIGTALLTLGMLSGALWAKDAWGHYWNWDPKETWAAATWFLYVGYIHWRLYGLSQRHTLPYIESAIF